MHITATITFDNAQEFAQFAVGFANPVMTVPAGFPPIPQDGIQFPPTPVKATVPAKKSASAKAEAPVIPNESIAPIAPISDAQPAQVPAGAGTASPSTDAIEYKTVSDAVLKLVANKAKGGREKALEILATHGVNSARELQPEQYADVLADLNAALAA